MPDDPGGEPLARADLRSHGWPPLLNWWPTYVLVGAGAAVALFAAAGVVFDAVRPVAHLLVIVLLAGALAFALDPLVDALEARVGKRAIAVLIVFAVMLAALVAAGVLVATPLASEGRRLGAVAEEYRAKVENDVAIAVGPVTLPTEVADALLAMRPDGAAFASQLAAIALGAVTVLVDAALVLVIALYFALDAHRARAALLRALPLTYRRRARVVAEEVGRVFGAYMRGQLILAGTIAIASTGVLLVAGMPYAFVLGLFAGIAELVPMFGPFIGAVPAVVVALAQPFPAIVIVLAGYLVIQELEAHVLVPRVSGDAVGLRPVVAMLALIGGFEIGGVLGALFAVPIAGVVWVFVSTAVRASRGRPRGLAGRRARARRRVA